MSVTGASPPQNNNTPVRELLQKSALLAVGLVGPPGAGKTSLVEATARQLRGKVRLGVITINPAAERDADRVSRYCSHVEAVCTARPDPTMILSVLKRFQLSKLDVLLMDLLATPDEIPHLGQDITVAVLSVGAGDDKAPLYADLLRNASALILNKADLQRHVMFDRGAFWADVHRINPELDLMEVSAFENRGVDRWLAWLDKRRLEKNPQGKPLEA